MIVAYCDHCGLEIPGNLPAGVRLVVGKEEVSFHLCRAHQLEMFQMVRDYVTQPGEVEAGWRVVK